MTSESDIGKLAQPVLSVPEVYNEFCSALVNRIVYTQFLAKAFRNPFVVLEGDALPLGYAGQEGYVNPAKGRVYNPDDAAINAIKSLDEFRDIDLIEYHVDAITGGTDAFIDVIIKLQKGDKVVSARGTEADIINASVKAYIAGVNRLLRD